MFGDFYLDHGRSSTTRNKYKIWHPRTDALKVGDKFSVAWLYLPGMCSMKLSGVILKTTQIMIKREYNIQMKWMDASYIFNICVFLFRILNLVLMLKWHS